MTSKFLFIASVTVSLLGTLTLADHASAAPRTREQVAAEAAKAAKDGTLQRTDYDADARYFATSPTTATRAQLDEARAAAAKARASLLAPDRNGSYNPFGTQILNHSELTRAAVKDEARAAVANGTLPRTDYDAEDEELVARRIAQRLKTLGSPAKPG